MLQQRQPPSSRVQFAAFISYRHIEPDRAWAKWLQRDLETFRIPRKLAAKGQRRRLGRVFRDEDELPASADLSKEVTTALGHSEYLIVVCSPRASTSEWINAEVEYFRSLGRHDKILALLIEGEPSESFPPALTQIRRVIADRGGVSLEHIEEVEPLAADVRPGRPDLHARTLRRHACFRLIACIIGCRFDELRRRAAEERARIMRNVGVGMATLLLLMSGLTAFAFFQRSEARARAADLQQVSDFQAQMLSRLDLRVAGVELTRDVRHRFDTVLAKTNESDADRSSRVEAFVAEWQRVNPADVARDTVDRMILTPAVSTIEKQFTEQPLLAASLRQVLADRYRELGLYDAASRLQQQALDARRRSLGDKHPDTLESLHSMGVLQWRQGHFAEAEQLFDEVLRDRRRILGEDHRATLVVIDSLGALLNAQGKLPEAEAVWKECLERRQHALGEQDPDTLASVSNMGLILKAEGNFPKAEQYLKAALDGRRRSLGDDHADTLMSINNLGFLYHDEGRLAAAEPFYREVLKRARAILGNEHPDTLVYINNMAGLLQEQGHPEEAGPMYRDVVEQLKRTLGDEHPQTMVATNGLASWLGSQRRFSEAEQLLKKVLEVDERVLGSDHPETLLINNNIGFELQSQGKVAEAETYYQRALSGRRRVLGADHPDTLVSMNNLAAVLRAEKKWLDAERLLREAVSGFERSVGKTHWHTGGVHLQLGQTLVELGRFSDAEAELLEAHRVLKDAEGAPPSLGRKSADALVSLYHSWAAADPDKGHEVSEKKWKAEREAVSPGVGGPEPTSGRGKE